MNHIVIDDKSKCCGCGACLQKCPKKAITLEYDKEGFWYPHIDNEKCVDCGLCVKVCHLLNENYNPDETETKASYCAYNKSDEIMKDSSSGGIFWLLVEYALSKGGVVYGAVAEGFNVFHRRGETAEECIAFRKSKYLQSDTKNTYVEAQTDLRAGRLVLYSGTPCQIAGLYSFLGKKYENLITCDVVCHGVPSRAAFDKWLDELTQKNNGIRPVSMVWRDKVQGWGPNRITYTFEDGHTWTCTSKENLFQKGFLSNLYLRPSCYECKYARLPRIADISLADFWGYDGELKDRNQNKGLSIVILSTDTAIKVFDSINVKTICESADIEYIKQHSRHVWKEPKINKNRESFFKLLNSKTFFKSATKFLTISYKHKLYIRIKQFVKSLFCGKKKEG